jgi:predicted dehydrogenase
MYVGWADLQIRARAIDGVAVSLDVPERYRVIPAALPSGPPANVAALYRELARAITEGWPAHPSFETAVRHHRLIAAAERSSQTGSRQTIAIETRAPALKGAGLR